MATFSLRDLCGCPNPCPECCTDCCDGTLSSSLTLTINKDPGPGTASVTLNWTGAGWESDPTDMTTFFGCSVTDMVFTLACSGDGDCALFSLAVDSTGYHLDPTFDVGTCVCPPGGALYLKFNCDKTVDDCSPCLGSGSSLIFEVTDP